MLGLGQPPAPRRPVFPKPLCSGLHTTADGLECPSPPSACPLPPCPTSALPSQKFITCCGPHSYPPRRSPLPKAIIRRRDPQEFPPSGTTNPSRSAPSPAHQAGLFTCVGAGMTSQQSSSPHPTSPHAVDSGSVSAPSGDPNAGPLCYPCEPIDWSKTCPVAASLPGFNCR